MHQTLLMDFSELCFLTPSSVSSNHHSLTMQFTIHPNPHQILSLQWSEHVCQLEKPFEVLQCLQDQQSAWRRFIELVGVLRDSTVVCCFLIGKQKFLKKTKNSDLFQQIFSSTHFLLHSMATPSFWKDHKPHYWLCFALLGHHSYKHMRRKDLRSRCSRDLLRSKILTSYVLTRMVKKERQVNNEPPDSSRAASKDLRMANCEEEALAASSSSSSYSSWFRKGLNPKGSPIGEAH